METQASVPSQAPKDFIREIIDEDLQSHTHQGIVVRFPPEPNGYLHIGHAKSICLNFGLAQEYNGRCHLRFDDTNPAKEELEYVESIQQDVKWLGFDWNGHLFFASDYFEKLYDFATELIEKGLAYVDSLSPDEMKSYRGTLTEPGKNSPYRDRSVAENLDLFKRMKEGEFPDGAHVLRAKIDMASPNLNLRDPALYRIKRTHHHRTGDAWCLYPMYDYTHPISDALEGITHSICTLEFEDHRPLYDWVLKNISIHCHPQQIEFARLNLTHTVMSKRKLLELVTSGAVTGWDDPRMPTLAGMRRRGYTPAGIRNFCAAIGVTKANGVVEYGLLEHFIREDLNRTAERRMVVLKPLKVIIENYPEGQTEELRADNNPEDPTTGERSISFGREIYIEHDDFREEAPKKWFRLSPGKEVRLKHAYYVTCREVIKDASGEVVELRCTYDPESRGGTTDKRPVKGTLHWVNAQHAIPVTVRNYGPLLRDAQAGSEMVSALNPESLEVMTGCLAEPSLASAAPGQHYQFLRMGYYSVDSDSRPDALVFNRTATLKDAWARLEKRDAQNPS
ncbi:MAG: glutamine--tRNA ligase/YqeY domain fusion protein [Candidatus Sericytochromatia bacterium]|nr:glutamine--tRNA ligase/YqeY domain fusion protein [Candidatus Sericytochromatia bacterium]